MPFPDPDIPDSSPQSSEPGSQPGSLGTKKIIAVGGGRGGVGKSVVASNLAVYFAQLGRPVVLVDCDPTGANIHCHFGVPAGSKDAAVSGVRGSPVIKNKDSDIGVLYPTNVPGLRLLPAGHDSVDVAPA